MITKRFILREGEKPPDAVVNAFIDRRIGKVMHTEVVNKTVTSLGRVRPELHVWILYPDDLYDENGIEYD